jgi:hypothetical protein
MESEKSDILAGVGIDGFCVFPLFSRVLSININQPCGEEFKLGSLGHCAVGLSSRR